MDKLIQLSDHEIRIDFALASKCRTTIHLTSLISSAPVAFKVQTSSPHKFLVNPPSGLLPPLASAAFQIVLKPQSQIPPNFPRSPSDRFLVKAAAAPDLAADQPVSGQSEIVNRWFNSAPHRSSYDVKLKVYFVGPFLLSRAAGAGDFDAVKGIIKRQRSVISDLSVREVESLYELAKPHPDVMGLLLDAGLRVLDVGEELSSAARWTELHIPAVSDRTAEVERGQLMDVVEVLERGKAVFHAARRGELEELESVLENGATTNFCDEYGFTALHIAAMKGYKDVVMILIEFGADVDCPDAEGHTPLHLAVEGGSIDTVEILINRGARVNAKTRTGVTPLQIAKLMEHEGIIRLLLDSGASSSVHSAASLSM